MEAVKITFVLVLCWFAPVQSITQEQVNALERHNKLRKLHGVPPYTLSDQLCKESAEYAQALTTSQSLEYSKSDGLYGENLCLHSHSPESCIQMWYDENQDYDYSKPRFSFKTGHFTQVVWAGSTEMGWGQARDSDGVYYVVARYTPAGNLPGEFAKNIFDPKTISAAGKIKVSRNALSILICVGLLKFTYCH